MKSPSDFPFHIHDRYHNHGECNLQGFIEWETASYEKLLLFRGLEVDWGVWGSFNGKELEKRRS
jgi:hypothetical protein